MKQTITLAEPCSQTEWLYAPNHVYYADETCQRHLQIIFPYRADMPKDEAYPLILFIPGSAWHKQEMYNDIPKLAELARLGYVVAEPFHMDMERAFLMGNSSGGHIAMMAALLNAHGGAAYFSKQVLDLVQDFCQRQS